MPRKRPSSRQTMKATAAAAAAKRRKSQSRDAERMRKKRREDKWRDDLNTFESLTSSFYSKKGKSRTFEENKMIILAMKASLKRRLKSGNELISWHCIENEVSKDFGFDRNAVYDLRKRFFEDGDVYVFGGGQRGSSAPEAKQSINTKINSDILLEIAKFVDDNHVKGKAVVSRDIVALLFTKYQIKIHRTTAARAIAKLGLSWTPIKSAKRTFSSHRKKAIRDYLIALNRYVKGIENGTSDCVFVFTDESYININHGQKRSYLPKNQQDENTITRKSGRGRRLIMLHAITVDGPLAEIDAQTGFPIDDLKWRGDTPHSTKQPDSKMTAELLWMANSSTGDYHDNMNSDNFMKWVKEKLVPCFKKKYPRKKMVLVADNAPYHHKRVIGSLGGLSKKKVIDMMVKYNVTYLELPITTHERLDLAETEEDNSDVQNRGDVVSIDFLPEEQLKRASVLKPRVATSEELKVAFVTFLKKENPELLECKVEAFLAREGYDVLWTPPYCPELQPIELFWASGKNHVALKFQNDFKMRDIVKYLREGWYGNGNQFIDGHPYQKKPVDCRKLWNTCLKFARTKFIPLCDGISGTVEDLVIDENYVDEEVDVPIDTLVLNLANEDVDDELNNEQAEV